MSNILNLPVVIGFIFFLLGLLPITKVTIGGVEAFLGKPINVWQKSIFIFLGTLFLVFSLHKYFIPDKPHFITFNGIVCKPYEKYLQLEGERIFLRSSEFQDLNLPIGTEVKLTVDVDGSEKSTLLILDSDKKIDKCPLLISRKIRRTLGIDADIDVDAGEKEDWNNRPERRWKVTSNTTIEAD
ncbi:MAG: hypothetical protein F6K54_22740 [Okeania sp. SIO3B5]|uniref:hypothetical protein n=1 Tax=Okeania sp. SIO3B5 TaxID=2607811 RepID=UPI001400E1D4|nr:hypothetical protein [Okeania sp. SIO3B5]NEO55638.1 hypothetical protein [Okeania sp. SIO3B5]